MSTKKFNIIQRVDDMGNVEETLPESSASLAETLPQSQKVTVDWTTPVSNTSASGYNYKAYSESPVVQEAYDLLQKHLGTTPTYTSTYSDQLKSQLEAILAGKDFKYDLNGDMLYQQYKDMYTNQAKMAMADTMGQAAAMTGGYGNSYAQTVGQQMYQQQMQGLNDKIPELYQMALDKHNMERQTMLDEYSLLADAENREYSKFMDEYNQWLSNRDYLANSYYNERNFDYTKHSDEQSYKYAQSRDAAADKLASENAAYEYNKWLLENGYTTDENGNAVPITDYYEEARKDMAAFGYDEKAMVSVAGYLKEMVDGEYLSREEAAELYKEWYGDLMSYNKK